MKDQHNELIKRVIKLNKMKSILIVLLFGHFSGCNNPSENSSNNIPEITNISISPLPAKADKWIYITAVAVDKDGDKLTYFWSCSSGEFFPGDTDKNPTSWKNEKMGKHSITCTVSDGKETSSKTVSVDVVA